MKNIFPLLFSFLFCGMVIAQPGDGAIVMKILKDSSQIGQKDSAYPYKDPLYGSLSKNYFIKITSSVTSDSNATQFHGTTLYSISQVGDESGFLLDETIFISPLADRKKIMSIKIKNINEEYYYIINPIVFQEGNFEIDLPNDWKELKKSTLPYFKNDYWDITPIGWKNGLRNNSSSANDTTRCWGTGGMPLGENAYRWPFQNDSSKNQCKCDSLERDKKGYFIKNNSKYSGKCFTSDGYLIIKNGNKKNLVTFYSNSERKKNEIFYRRNLKCKEVTYDYAGNKTSVTKPYRKIQGATRTVSWENGKRIVKINRIIYYN